MQFHINHTPADPGFKINHSDGLFLSGSCFAENMGDLLKAHRFNTCINPNGILFNPFSIHNSLQQLLHGAAYDQNFILEREGLYLSYLHHSSVYANNKHALIENINAIAQQASQFLKQAQYLVITFGSAYVYRHLQLNAVVANCHKQPSASFAKELAGVDEIVKLYTALLADLKTFNPKLRIIFTVSPVKYLKDGLVENSLSKSTLLLAVHQLVQQNDNCFYFPAYELVNDDLRDYRFYKKDLAHPNEQAIEYVWEKFSGTFFSEHTNRLIHEIHRLNLALQHRQLHSDSQEAQKLNAFIARQQQEIQRLEPGISF